MFDRLVVHVLEMAPFGCFEPLQSRHATASVAPYDFVVDI